MSVAVLVPVGGSDPYRRRAWRYVREFYGSFFPHWHLVEVTDDCEANRRFEKPYAVNRAVAALPSAYDVLVLNDADSLVMPHQVARAVEQAYDGPGLVFAYRRYRRLGRSATDRIVSAVDAFRVSDADIEWEKVESGSHGCIAIRRDCFERAGGLDEAFGSAGYEDLAFNTVCEALWPSRRVGGDLLHMWHPREWDADEDGSAWSRARYEGLYLQAWGDAEKLLALVRPAA